MLGLLVCFAAIICIIYGLRQRRYRYALSSLLCFAVAFILWAIMLEVSEFHNGNIYGTLNLHRADVPWLWYASALAALSAIITFILCRSISYKRQHITPSSIRLCADYMPCGICYWFDGGKVIFTNDSMMELCFALTGYALQNGEEFSAAVTAPILQVGDKVWSFTRRIVELKGKPLHEMIAADVTELYEKTKALKTENEEIARYNESLRAYKLYIDETVRQQEILQAKVNIHDEMNRLMLTTVAAGSDGGGSVDDAFALWQNNALLLCREAADDGSSSVEELERIAKALKITLVWHNTLPETITKKQRGLFFSAAQEAIANAFKHAGAKSLEIDFTTSDNGIKCDFTNRGKLPEREVSFTGGLGNLKSLADMQGAEVYVKVNNCFTLSIFLPKDEKKYAVWQM